MKKEELSLKQIQDNSFVILKKIKEIFDKNGWKYYLAYGTLLGAIRHNGFIPWDDDIDIWVPRDDYEKFLDYCKKNQSELKPFQLIHYSTNKGYVYTISRFSDSRFLIDYDNVNDYGLGLFVDIYPLDGLNINDKKIRKKIIKYMKKINICGSKSFVSSGNPIKDFLKKPYYFFVKKLNLNNLLRKNDLLAQKYAFKDSEFFDCVCWEVNDNKYKKELLEGRGELFATFNGEKFRIPCGYDYILKNKYGNYMKLPEEKDRIGHHYYKAYRK